MRFIESKGFAALFLLLISFGIYSFSLTGEFVWDDVQVIEKSYYSFQASNVISHLVPEEKTQKRARYWRPVLYGSYVADMAVWDISPFGFHLSNVLFNCAAVVAFYFLSLLVFGAFMTEGKERAAFFAGLLFALHPMHTESVAWVSGRTDVLAGLFFFLAFIFHVLLSTKSPVRFVLFLFLGAVGYSLSLLSKEVAVAFPLCVIFYDIITGRIRLPSSLAAYAVYAAITFGYIYLRGRGFVNVPEVNVAQLSPSGDLSAAAGAGSVYLGAVKTLLPTYFYYSYKLLFPFDFNAFIAAVPGDALYVISSGFFIAVVMLAGLYGLIKGKKPAAFGLFWTFATLGPSALIAVFALASTPLAERYLYIPSAGYCLLLAYILTGRKLPTPKAGVVAVGLISILFATFTVARQFDWQTNLELWENTSKKSFASALPHVNYGYALQKSGRYKEAIFEFEAALHPDIADTKTGRAISAINLGNVYIELGNYGRAEQYFQKALGYDPFSGRAYYHLGLISFIRAQQTGDRAYYGQAALYLLESLKRRRSYGRAHLLLAKTYLESSRLDKAREHAEKALRSGLVGELKEEAEEIRKINDKGR